MCCEKIFSALVLDIFNPLDIPSIHLRHIKHIPIVLGTNMMIQT